MLTAKQEKKRVALKCYVFFNYVQDTLILLFKVASFHFMPTLLIPMKLTGLSGYSSSLASDAGGSGDARAKSTEALTRALTLALAASI